MDMNVWKRTVKEGTGIAPPSGKYSLYQISFTTYFCGLHSKSNKQDMDGRVDNMIFQYCIQGTLCTSVQCSNNNGKLILNCYSFLHNLLYRGCIIIKALQRPLFIRSTEFQEILGYCTYIITIH